MKTLKISSLLITLIFIYGFVGNMDMQDQQIEQQHYCQMVGLWRTSGGTAGWPDYNQNASEVCTTGNK